MSDLVENKTSVGGTRSPDYRRIGPKLETGEFGMKRVHSVASHTTRLLVLLLLVGTGCHDSQQQSSAPRVATAVPPPAVPPPSVSKAILAQPMLEFSDGTVTYQGTAYFVRAPSGGVAAVTASHFLNQEGPALVKVSFLTGPRSQLTTAAAATESWGVPGDYGLRPPKHELDLRTDRFLLPVTLDEQSINVLELDDRPVPTIGERAWFPDKQPDEPGGFKLIEGTVAEVNPGYLIVDLDSSILAQSQSGSPVLSQLTGKVLGSWAGFGTMRGKTFVLLNPAREIRKALEQEDRLLLSSVVGRSKPIESLP